MALPGLKGLTQTKVSKRIEELAASHKHATAPAVAAAGGERPAPGDAGGTTALVKLVSKIKHAIRKETLVRTVTVTGKTGAPFAEIPVAGAILAGFKYTMTAEGTQGQLATLQPIYWTPKGTADGNRWGADAGLAKSIVAKKGYAVAGVRSAGAGYDIRWFEVIFARLGPDGLDMTDKYASQWTGTKWYTPVTMGDNGQLVVGIFGSASQTLITGLGLVQVPEK
jgi:hypothetical protein